MERSEVVNVGLALLHKNVSIIITLFCPLFCTVYFFLLLFYFFFFSPVALNDCTASVISFVGVESLLLVVHKHYANEYTHFPGKKDFLPRGTSVSIHFYFVGSPPKIYFKKSKMQKQVVRILIC